MDSALVAVGSLQKVDEGLPKVGEEYIYIYIYIYIWSYRLERRRWQNLIDTRAFLFGEEVSNVRAPTL
jgi:hypothetical protein